MPPKLTWLMALEKTPISFLWEPPPQRERKPSLPPFKRSLILIIKVAIDEGVNKIRITGGEPLLRDD